MNWIKENKFLAGFIAILVVGVGVLGWFVMSAKTAAEEAEGSLVSQSAELNRLLTLPLFPNQDNVKKLDEQKKQVEAAFKDLQKSLAANEIPIEQLSPIEFQNALHKTVIDVREKAASANTKLPEKFYLDFDKYETEPPDKDAAAPLARQVKAITWVVQQFISAKAIELKLAREPLAEENTRARGPQTPAPGAQPQPQPRAGRADDKSKNLVTKNWFEIVVLIDQNGFTDVLNKIVASPEQFYIPRIVEVKNEKQEPPARTPDLAALAAPVVAPVSAPGVAPAPGVVQPPAPAAQPAEAKKYIVGDERVEVTLRIEIVDFADVAAK